jgi:hypothetical protein
MIPMEFGLAMTWARDYGRGGGELRAAQGRRGDDSRRWMAIARSVLPAGQGNRVGLGFGPR